MTVGLRSSQTLAEAGDSALGAVQIGIKSKSLSRHLQTKLDRNQRRHTLAACCVLAWAGLPDSSWASDSLGAALLPSAWCRLLLQKDAGGPRVPRPLCGHLQVHRAPGKAP